MIADLKPYPKLKDSRVQWLGEVPGHWEVSKIKSLARPGYKTFVDGDWIESPYITPDGIRLIQTGNIGTGEYREKGFRYISEETFKNFCCTEVEPDDILICRLGEPVARTCLAPRIGKRMITSVDVCILKPRAEANAKFFVYSMSSRRYLDWVGSLVRGSTRDRVSRSMLGSFAVPVPSLPEQFAIVRFLNHADRLIWSYIQAKQRLIALLKEQNRAIVHQAVTGRIDVRTGLPYQAYKDSGVEWLGKVPGHWEVRRAKYFYREVDERSTSGAEILMSVSHKTGVTPRKKNVTMFLAETNVGYKLCQPGDIVINTMWAYMAALGVARQNGIVSPSYGVYRPSNHEKTNQDYIDNLLRIEVYRSEYFTRSTGITASRLRLYADSFLGVPLLRPPFPDQVAIANYISKVTEEIDTAISLTRRQVELFLEYRTRLIADVVTGKLDVREAAAAIPDDSDAPGEVKGGSAMEREDSTEMKREVTL